MRPLQKLTLEDTGDGWLVVCGDRFASHLQRDETLGVVAALLFGGGGLPYLETYAQHNRRCSWMWDDAIAGLLPATVAPMPTSDFVIYRRELLADVKGC